MKRASLIFVSACALAGTLAFGSARAGHIPVPDFPIPGTANFFLKECSKLRDPGRDRCYVKGLLEIVEDSGDPATELPQIDKKVRASGGYLQSECHILMHEVGRTFARRHRVTIATLYKYVPRSNDPGCSAGFGMGLVMHLGTQIVLEPRSVLPVCTSLPSRFREYTCVHGSGHAFMRGYHGRLEGAVPACQKLGPRFTPDCAQGAFHDYWISLSGGDGTTRPEGAETNPRAVCGGYSFARPCWYRFFWERRQSARAEDADDLRALCKGLAGVQRAGCIGGASLLLTRGREPMEHARVCRGLSARDSVSCLRGVNVPALAGNRYEQLRLLRSCAKLAKAAHTSCYGWFGRTFNVVANGRFERDGCPQLRTTEARAACVAGARRYTEALGTFS